MSLLDLLFSFLFALFVACAVFVEAPVCMGERVSADSAYPGVAISYPWGMEADRVWVEQPWWSRVAVCFHSFGFGVFYAFFSLAFLVGWVRRSRTVRQLGVVVGAAKLYAGAFYMTTNLLHPEIPPARPVLFVTQSALYMLVPFFLIVRCWSDPVRVVDSTKKTR